MVFTVSTETATSRPSQSWVVALAVLWTTSMVEAFGVSQIGAFMPLYLQEMGVLPQDVPHLVGVMNSLVFVLGLPLVPLWGVWADKYSRKAIIIRSALVEAVVFGLVAISREPWQLAVSLMMVGFQLGNTGVMLSALRDLAPKRRLGTVIAIFGSSSPVGFAVGPAVSGMLIDGLHTPIWTVYALSGVLSVGTALVLGIGFREVRPTVIPTGRVAQLAFGAIRSVLTDRTTRRLFILFGMAFLARQMSGPFLPILVQRLNSNEFGLASAVALVVGTAALVGGLISPFTGALGDRVGFRPVLAAAMLGAGLTLILMPLAPTVPALAVSNVFYAALNATVTAMIFGLIAMEVAPERSSATLNLVYLPLYITGIIGPSLGAIVVAAGLPTAFTLAGLELCLGTALVFFWARRDRSALRNL